MKASSHYPLKGELEYFCRPGRGYTPAGVLRAMAMHIDGVVGDRKRKRTVEAIMVYPNDRGWAGAVLYQDVTTQEAEHGEQPKIAIVKTGKPAA